MYSKRLEKFRQKKHLFNEQNADSWQWRHDSVHVVHTFASPIKYNMFYVLVPDNDFELEYWHEMVPLIKPCHQYIY